MNVAPRRKERTAVVIISCLLRIVVVDPEVVENFAVWVGIALVAGRVPEWLAIPLSCRPIHITKQRQPLQFIAQSVHFRTGQRLVRLTHRIKGAVVCACTPARRIA